MNGHEKKLSDSNSAGAAKNHEPKHQASNQTSSTKGKGKLRTWGDKLGASAGMAASAMTPKPQPSSLSDLGMDSKAASGASSSSHPESSARETAAYRTNAGSTGGQSMRSHVTPEAASHDYDQFLDETPSLPQPSEIQSSTETGNSAPSMQQDMDGAAVVQLLDQPDAYDEVADTTPATMNSDNNNDDDDLSPQEAVRLQTALFGSGSRAVAWDNLLNLTPDFLDGDATGHGAGDLELLTGYSDPLEARRSWLDQWSDVLSSYTDQVWGQLGPLAKQAKKEVDDAAEAAAADDGGGEPVGLRRLRQILGHVRGSQGL